MKTTPLNKLTKLGQSIWLDFIHRNMFTSHELQELIAKDDLRGITSNPAIFEKAISDSEDYKSSIQIMALEDTDPNTIYQKITVEDVATAADLLRPVYDDTLGRDGFVSLEVSPLLAHNPSHTIAEAKYLWRKLNRPNVMIKVPGTIEGLTAIKELTTQGINVNVTLLFDLDRYKEVIYAYISGLEERVRGGKPINQISSVASFFLSRIDVLIDPLLEAAMKEGGKTKAAALLHGKIAISSAKTAYQIYKKVFFDNRFLNLKKHGANTQRLLWASTSTKNPAYSDTKYVEPLIGQDTVNTMPITTINAYRDHGQPELTLEKDVNAAVDYLKELKNVGIDLKKATEKLEAEGIEKFILPFYKLLTKLGSEKERTLKRCVNRQEVYLGKYQSSVSACIDHLVKKNALPRIWDKDASLWKQDQSSKEQIQNSLGWLNVIDKMREQLILISSFVDEIKKAGFSHILHMGMGGSSLAPLVLKNTFAASPSAIPVTVLDTTDPTTIQNIEKKLPLKNTLFIVATKSGTTAEPIAFTHYFFEEVKKHKNEGAGENFIAITDPDSPLIDLAKKVSFRRVFLNFSDIGGRYSALSFFGLIPFALMGGNIGELLVRSAVMKHKNTTEASAKESQAIILGATLGELSIKGRDKVTFIIDEPISAFGLWLEQLLAESTGKEGKGLMPIVGESIGNPSSYGVDRIFVHITLESSKDESITSKISALQNSGHPVIKIQMKEPFDLGQEFFKWELATAVSGIVLGINPFDQPNVQETKDNTNRILATINDKKYSVQERPDYEEQGVLFFGSKSCVINGIKSSEGILAELIHSIRPCDYLAIMAYVTEDEKTTKALEAIRLMVRDRLRIATTLCYGPRFLHSTGQIHKGGPDTGVFLQITSSDEAVQTDQNIPRLPYTFAMLKHAQAIGDFESLNRHGRRVLRIHIKADLASGLKLIDKTFHEAIKRQKEAA